MNAIDIITATSGIVAVLAFFWVFFFGSKTIFEVVKNKRKGNKPTARGRKPRTNVLLIVNIFWLIVVFLLSSVLFIALNVLSSLGATRASVPTTAYSANQTKIFMTSPHVPVIIPCSVNCVSRLDVALKNAVFESALNGVLMTFILTNQEKNVCNLGVEELGLEDALGRKNDARGQIRSINVLNPGQVLEAVAFFSFTPSSDSPYLLSLVLSCRTDMPMVYQDESISFGTPGLSVAAGFPVTAPQEDSTLRVTIAGSLLGVLISLVFLIDWLVIPSPFGALQQGEQSVLLKEIHARSLLRNLFRKSKISSRELERCGFDFGEGRFDLDFKRSRRVSIRAKPRSSPMYIRHDRSAKREIVSKRGVYLVPGDFIGVEGFSEEFGGFNEARFLEYPEVLPEER